MATLACLLILILAINRAKLVSQLWQIATKEGVPAVTAGCVKGLVGEGRQRSGENV